MKFSDFLWVKVKVRGHTWSASRGFRLHLEPWCLLVEEPQVANPHHHVEEAKDLHKYTNTHTHTHTHTHTGTHTHTHNTHTHTHRHTHTHTHTHTGVHTHTGAHTYTHTHYDICSVLQEMMTNLLGVVYGVLLK